MRDYKKYDVWEKAHHLVLFIYKEVLPGFPKEELFGLISQLKRAASSVPLNVVEGCGRHSEKDFVHFLDMALGSLHEVEYCSLLAFELGYILPEKNKLLVEKINEVKAKLITLIKTIRQTQ